MTTTNLFQLGKVVLSSGQQSDFKIDCDALTDADIECLAYLISQQVKFREVYGVPTGGSRLSSVMEKYAERGSKLPVLIVDDVFTTGKSITRFAAEFDPNGWIGFVIFARNDLPANVQALFKM